MSNGSAIEYVRKQGFLVDVDIGVGTDEATIGIFQAASGAEKIQGRSREKWIEKSAIEDLQKCVRKAASAVYKYTIPFPGKGRFANIENVEACAAEVEQVRQELKELIADPARREKYEESRARCKTRAYEDIDNMVATSRLEAPAAAKLKVKYNEESLSWEQFTGKLYVELRVTPIPRPAEINEALETYEKVKGLGAGWAAKLEEEQKKFLQGYLPYVRSMITDYLKELQERVATNGKVHGASLVKLQGLFDKARSFDIFGDQEMKGILDDFEKKYLGGNSGQELSANKEALKAFQDDVAKAQTALTKGAEKAFENTIGKFGVGRAIE